MKVWMIIGACLIATGVVICTVALVALGFNFKNISTQNMETNIYTPEEDFSNISLDVRTADIHFVAAEDGKTKVVCYEEAKLKHNIRVSQDTLIISQADEQKWYDHINFYTEKASVTVYLPAAEYDTLSLNCTTGDLSVAQALSFKTADVSATTGDICWNANTEGSLTLSCTTGDVTTKNVQCGSLNIHTATGDVKLTNTQVVGNLNVKVTTGDVKLERVDAAEINIKATSGDVEGTLLSDKIFIVENTTGDVTVPQSSAGGKCTVKTTTGDIEFRIEK